MALNKYLTSNPSIGRYILVFMATCTFLGFICTAIDNFDNDISDKYGIWGYLKLVIPIVIVIFVNHFILSSIFSKIENSKNDTENSLNTEYQQKTETLYSEYQEKEKSLIDHYEQQLHVALKNTRKPDNIKFARFEQLHTISSLIYGYVEYKPFFYLNDLDSQGIGYEVLSKIFSPFRTLELKAFSYPLNQRGNNWENVFEDLCKKQFDLIMTPLFETRSRIYNYNISFCTPIFYSNIGIYIRQGSISGSTSLQFSDAISFIREKIKHHNWRAKYIKGELSESLLSKYNLSKDTDDNMQTPIYPATDQDFASALSDVSADGGDQGDFIFMEVFKANSIMNKYPTKFKLTNILADNQLLYPVSFVVRKEETILKNIINLRLIELRKSGELENIIKKEALKVNISEDEFPEIFIQTYDFDKLKKASS